MNDLINRLQELSDSFSPKQRELAAYILNNYKEVAFMNSVQLAAKTNMSNPTIIRFATFLGYSGYPEFQANLQELVQNDLSSIERLNFIAPDNNDINRVVYETEIANISAGLHHLDSNQLSKVINLIATKKNIYVCGFQVSTMLAYYTEYCLSKVRENIILIDNWDRRTFNMLHEDNSDALALLFAFPRYPQKTMQLIKSLYEMNIPIILITDSVMFPYKNYVLELMPVPIKHVSFIDPVSSVLCLVNTILIGVAEVNKEKTTKYMSAFEKYNQDNNVFFKK